MPKKLTTILGESLIRVAGYAIKTGIGISKETYHHTNKSLAFESGR
jgi:hypothetical protein